MLRRTLLFFLLCLPATSALAQSCVLQLGDAFDFGRRFIVGTPAERPLGTRTAQLTISCDSPQALALALDASALPAGDAFRLDAAGRFAVRIAEATVDGQAAQLGRGAAPTDVPRDIADTQRFERGLVVIPTRDGIALTGRTLSARVEVEGWLDALVPTTLNDDTRWSVDAGLRLLSTGDQAAMRVEIAAMPAACNLSLSNNGNIDLGTIPVETLAINGPTSLPTRSLSVNISCPAAGAFATAATENRPNTAWLADGSERTANRSFGLGRTSNGTPIGAYQLRVKQAQADGIAATPIVGSPLAGWYAPAEAFIEHGPSAPMNAVRSSGTAPAQATTATWQVDVLPAIAPQTVLKLRGVEQINGSMTLTLEYP